MRRLLAIALLCITGIGLTACQAEAEGNRKQPNILLIIADDIGYSDLGSYGSEIRTPVLDGIAQDGIRVTSFYTATKCNPTRAMLMSGAENSLSGLGPRRGYHLNPDYTSLGAAMQQQGYRTYYSGKWDLGANEELRPAARGFNRSFAMLPGAMPHYNEPANANRGAVVYSRDGEAATRDEGFYSTRNFTDELLSMLEEDNDQPFFAVLSYTAPHWPLQVDEAYSEPYFETYAQGWHAARESRLAGLREAGLLSDDAQIGDYPAPADWTSLTRDEQAYEVKRMAVYAGMITYMDEQIGRVLAQLEQSGELDNTVIIFMGDNGGEGEPLEHTPMVADLGPSGPDNSYGNLGRSGSYDVLGPNWSRVANAPLSYWKGYALEGGIAAPMLVLLPNSGRAGEVETGFAHVTDLYPTLLDLAGASPDGRPSWLAGQSQLAVWNGVADAQTEREQGWFYSLNPDISRAMRKGDWKLVWTGQDGREARLFNIAQDRGEQTDLASENPEKLAELQAAWDRYAATNNIQLERPQE